jgi:hypothetical protein
MQGNLGGGEGKGKAEGGGSYARRWFDAAVTGTFWLHVVWFDRGTPRPGGEGERERKGGRGNGKGGMQKIHPVPGKYVEGYAAKEYALGAVRFSELYVGSSFSAHPPQ